VGRFPVNTGHSSGRSSRGSSREIKMSGTVLNITEAKRADGRGALSRIVKDKSGNDAIVDFWNDVTKLDAAKLEAVMQIAKSESDYDLTSFIRGIEYQGFDRLFYIKHALSLMSVSLFCRFAILGAIRGSNFTKIVDKCEHMPSDMTTAHASLGFVKTPKKRADLTILRCTASIPHWCAFYLQKAAVEKKMQEDCHAALQFPGAASLPMSRDVRIKHLNFCVAFSSLLPGGSFSLTIYMTAMNSLIPITDIPPEVLSLLGVSSITESYTLTSDDQNVYGRQVAIRK
jgi:hypothetical protein